MGLHLDLHEVLDVVPVVEGGAGEGRDLDEPLLVTGLDRKRGSALLVRGGLVGGGDSGVVETPYPQDHAFTGERGPRAAQLLLEEVYEDLG